MNVFEALFSALSNSTSVTAFSSQRIFPIVAPESAKTPFVTIHQISNIPFHAMESDADISEYRIQISSWTTDFSGVVSLSTAIKGVLRDYSGILGSSNFRVQRIFLDSEYDFPEINLETNKINYHRAQDYLVWTTG